MIRHNDIKHTVVTTVLMALCLFSFIACNRHSPNFDSLRRAETLMEDSIDIKAASDIVDRIDRQSLFDNERPLFDLIDAELRYKRFINDTDDSLVIAAAKHFEQQNDRRHLMRALMMAAKMQFFAGDNSRSAVNALEALSIAESLRDTLYMARLNDHLADVYELSSNASIAKRQKAASLFKSTTRTENYITALLQLSTDYYNYRDIVKSIEINDSARRMITPEDTLNYVMYLQNALCSNVFIENYSVAKLYADTLVNYADKDFLTAYDYAQIAQILTHENKLISAKKYLTAAENRINNVGANSTYHTALIKYYQATNNIDSLIIVYISLIKNYDLSFKELLDLNTEKAESIFYAQKAAKEALHAEKIKSTVIIIVLVVTLIAAFIIILYYIRIRQHKERIEQCMSDLRNLTIRVQSSNTQIEAMTNYIDNLFRHHFEIINKLSSEYFFSDNNSVARENILKKVSNVIVDMSSPECILQLYDGLNRIDNNIMIRIQEQVPSISNSDMEFLTFFYAGFDHRAISTFLNIKSGNYYNRRTRIKAKIENSNAPDKTEFLKPFLRRR